LIELLTVQRHVQHLLHGINVKASGCVLCECRLTEVDGHMVIMQVLPDKGGAKKVIGIVHVPNLDFSGQYSTESFLFCLVSGKEDKIINM